MITKKTGYPSIDKPWMKYYKAEAIKKPLSECSLYDYLWNCNKDYLQENAIDYFGQKITFKEFFSMIDEAAKAFLKLGVQEEEIVSVVTVSTVVSVVCFYALNKIGAVSNYLNVLAEENDLQGYFTEANSKVVVTLDLFSEKVCKAANVSNVEKIIIFSLNHRTPVADKAEDQLQIDSLCSADTDILLWQDFLKLANGVDEIQYKKDPRKMCLLAHTGGTTGQPKAVMLTDCAMNAVIDGHFCIMNSSTVLSSGKRNKVFLQVMIPFVVYGILTCTHLPLCYGWCLAIVPKFDGNDWHKYMERYDFNYVFAVPSYVGSILENKGIENMDFAGVRTLAVGGDGMNESLESDINKWLIRHNCNVGIVKGYGLSEVSATAISTFPECNKVGSVGIPLYMNNLMIYDTEKETEMGYGEIGEICLQCPSRMTGYMNNESATDELFITHKDGSEWLHTGDLGYIDEDGFLFLTGRMKRIIVTAKGGVGYKVFPNIPEEILNGHHAVVQSCIVGMNFGNDQILKAYIVLDENSRPNSDKIEQELRQGCEGNLPIYSRPAFYEFLDNLPITAAGKVDYRKLEEMANSKEV